MKRIESALQELGVAHGHTHFGNFVLVFVRDAKGEPDLSHPPRVYVIDFDQAVSTGPEKRKEAA